ncbi:PBSX family phage terminase large subunit [Streptobacillus felis]|uniref:PBSX family phage terminase large subunit n=1 Tax=Streptobacillus felis TaxID=1384509 RepID=A0A7Z0PI52_9FUSO|nr:PBSX family phage terminase large subunit [Streptobacillus felis]
MYLPSIIGKGYKKFWNCKKRYLVVKGSRGSKKSKTTALKLIYSLMKYPNTNALVVRKTKETLKDSCYAELQWAINRLQVENNWKITKSPMEMIYKPTGQKILFRGLDSPLKLTSITVEKGIINFVWIEEAYEIMKEDDFNKIDMSIRGILPDEAYYQFIITFNPWNSKHWLKKRFFDNEDEDVEAILHK